MAPRTARFLERTRRFHGVGCTEAAMDSGLVLKLVQGESLQIFASEDFTRFYDL